MIGNIKNFRFWCQKVIPLVYDNSLSYYEVLCKVVNYLNHVIDDINKIPDYIDEKIKESINDEHIRQLISEVFRTLEDAISNNNEETNTHFSKDYPNLGTLLWHDNKLYETIRTIDQGDEIIEDVNIKLVNFGDMFDSFIDEVKKDFTPYDDGLRETASMNRPVHQLVWLNDLLYEVIKPITEGNAYIYTGENTNVSEITTNGLYQYLLGLIAAEVQTRESEDARIELEMSDLITSRVNAEAEARASEDARIELEMRDLITSRVNAEAEARANADEELNELIEKSKYILPNVATLLTVDYANVGDIIHLCGYYEAGDGGTGDFEISNTPDGFNHRLNNGLYANCVNDDIVLPRYGGNYVNEMVDNARQYIPYHNFTHVILPPANSKHPACRNYPEGSMTNYFWVTDQPIIYDEHYAYTINDYYGNIMLDRNSTNRKAIFIISDPSKPEDIYFNHLMVEGWHVGNVTNIPEAAVLVEGCARFNVQNLVAGYSEHSLLIGGSGANNTAEINIDFAEFGSCSVDAIKCDNANVSILRINTLQIQNMFNTCEYAINAGGMSYKWRINEMSVHFNSNPTNFTPILWNTVYASMDFGFHIGRMRASSLGTGKLVHIVGWRQICTIDEIISASASDEDILTNSYACILKIGILSKYTNSLRITATKQQPLGAIYMDKLNCLVTPVGNSIYANGISVTHFEDAECFGLLLDPTNRKLTVRYDKVDYQIS